jgi:hypothetical protein
MAKIIRIETIGKNGKVFHCFSNIAVEKADLVRDIVLNLRRRFRLLNDPFGIYALSLHPGGRFLDAYEEIDPLVKDGQQLFAVLEPFPKEWVEVPDFVTQPACQEEPRLLGKSDC